MAREASSRLWKFALVLESNYYYTRSTQHKQTRQQLQRGRIVNIDNTQCLNTCALRAKATVYRRHRQRISLCCFRLFCCCRHRHCFFFSPKTVINARFSLFCSVFHCCEHQFCNNSTEWFSSFVDFFKLSTINGYFEAYCLLINLIYKSFWVIKCILQIYSLAQCYLWFKSSSYCY